jgi:hypothetical protein
MFAKQVLFVNRFILLTTIKKRMQTSLYRVLFLMTFLVIDFQGFAQKKTSIFVPLELQEAYRKGTRSMDGKPGPSYWQNRADYAIKADFDPEKGFLSGQEIISYQNNSPEEVSSLTIRLYQDLYKKGNMRFRSVDPEDIHDGVKITKVSINGKSVALSDLGRNNTLMSVPVPADLRAEKKLKIEIDWNFTMPKKTDLREGYYENGNYFVAYWFPQMAVNDDIYGWDDFPYTGEQEFYNEFGNFEVEISTPKEYVIWATGVLQNPSEILQDKYLQRYQQAQTSSEIVKIIDKDDLKGYKITKGSKKNTWKFKAEYVPDFAFASSKSYLWEAGSVVVDAASGRNRHENNCFSFYRFARTAFPLSANDRL